MATTEIVHNITSLGEEVMVPPTRRGRPSMMTEDEARELTFTIQRLEVQAWYLISEAHDRRAWEAMGYETWKDYVAAELNMTEARSYQILDQAKVMKAIGQVDGVDAAALDAPPARVVAKIKNDLPGIRRAVKNAIKHETPIEDALRGLATKKARAAREETIELRAVPAAERAKRPQSKVACPACGGHGMVTVKRAKALDKMLA